MAVEAKRGCGFRKVGGLYLVSGGGGQDCDRIPIQLDVCPVCSHGFKQSRGWTWTDLAGLVGGDHLVTYTDEYPAPCSCVANCPVCHQVKKMGKAGLMWIGEKFYKTPEDFMAEGISLGFSRRIHAVPRNFKVGETWVLLAHPKVMKCKACNGAGITEDQFMMHASNSLPEGKPVPKCKKCEGSGKLPAIFTVWRPSRIEKIMPESKRHGQEHSDLITRGITPVFVPDDDKDHQGSVFDKAEEEEVEIPVNSGAA